MKVYISIKYHENYKNKMVVDEIISVLEKKGYEAMCIVRDMSMEEPNKYDTWLL